MPGVVGETREKHADGEFRVLRHPWLRSTDKSTLVGDAAAAISTMTRAVSDGHE
jgi:hypothetical protein